MELKEVFEKRRSVRKFKNLDISDEIIYRKESGRPIMNCK